MSEEDQELLKKISKISGKDLCHNIPVLLLTSTQATSIFTKLRQLLRKMTRTVILHRHYLGTGTHQLRQVT